MKLEVLYSEYKREFRRKGKKPVPDMLLSLLCLINKDKFVSGDDKGFEGFYKANKDLLDFYIEQVIKDFSFTSEELKKDDIFLANGILRDEKNILFDCFFKGMYVIFRYFEDEKYRKSSPEAMFELSCKIFGWNYNLVTRRYNGVRTYSSLSLLEKKYRQYLNRYKRDKRRPHPGILLILLILQDKDIYVAKNGDYQDFYLANKDKIDKAIKQLMIDFEITEFDLYMEYPTEYGQCGLIQEVGELVNDEVRENVFGKILSILSTALWLYPQLDDETTYDKVKELFKRENLTSDDIQLAFMTPQKKLNKSTNKYRLPSLEEQYQHYLAFFKKTGKHPRLNELLVLLLLPEKSKFIPLSGVAGAFYNHYKEEINRMIDKVCTDFSVSKEEIVAAMKPRICDDYERDKIWYVFCEGFGVVQWGNMYHPTSSPEEIHNEYSMHWGREAISEELLDKSKDNMRVKPRIFPPSLQQVYEEYLNDYCERGIYQTPSFLLFILLLQEKNNLKLRTNVSEFWQDNLDLILEKVKQIMIDFNWDLASLDKSDKDSDSNAIIWNAFLYGVVVTFWGIRLYPDWTAEMIYADAMLKDDSQQRPFISLEGTKNELSVPSPQYKILVRRFLSEENKKV